MCPTSARGRAVLALHWEQWLLCWTYRDDGDGVLRVLFFYHVVFVVELWGGSSVGRRGFSVQRRAIRLLKHHSLRLLWRGFSRTLAPNATLCTFSKLYWSILVIRALRAVRSGQRFPARHGGDLRTLRHRFSLSHIEMSSARVRFFNKLPSKSKASEERMFKNLPKEFLIKNEYFYPFRNSCLPKG